VEVTVIRIGSSLGLKFPDVVKQDFSLAIGTKVELKISSNCEVLLREKSKLREGWDAAFAQYAFEGEDERILPDFIDSETVALL